MRTSLQGFSEGKTTLVLASNPCGRGVRGGRGGQNPVFEVFKEQGPLDEGFEEGKHPPDPVSGEFKEQKRPRSGPRKTPRQGVRGGSAGGPRSPRASRNSFFFFWLLNPEMRVPGAALASEGSPGSAFLPLRPRQKALLLPLRASPRLALLPLRPRQAFFLASEARPGSASVSRVRPGSASASEGFARLCFGL
ncbi:hypothetical protein CRENBAI_005731 [Crenichthys baileyi]|uniref:Uncharacterized protein n=1 Tax=Crenichthys baileyi TaxID=28760 RepID=A0AAV9QYN6_9TELE